MPRRHFRQGFSLVELMIVVVIIGGMVAMMAPGLSELLADTRASAAASDLMRLSRHLRARVQQTGLAHVMVYTPSGSNGLGRIWVWEGMNNHCAQTPWIYAYNAFATAPTGSQAPVDKLEMGDPQLGYNPTGDPPPKLTDSDRQVVQLLAYNAGNLVTAPFGICFQPNGMTLVSDTPDDGSGTVNSLPPFRPHTTAYTFSIQRFVRHASIAVTHGVARRVVFAPGASGRFGL